MTDPLTEYLSKPCDRAGCDQIATHNGYDKGVPDSPYGKFCNAHTDWDRPAFARND